MARATDPETGLEYELEPWERVPRHKTANALRVIEDHQKGMTVVALVEKHRISRRTVYRILKAHHAEGDSRCTLAMRRT